MICPNRSCHHCIKEKCYEQYTLEELEKIKQRIKKEITVKEESQHDTILEENRKIFTEAKIDTKINEEGKSYSEIKQELPEIKQELPEIEYIPNDRFSAKEEMALQVINNLPTEQDTKAKPENDQDIIENGIKEKCYEQCTLAGKHIDVRYTTNIYSQFTVIGCVTFPTVIWQ